MVATCVVTLRFAAATIHHISRQTKSTPQRTLSTVARRCLRLSRSPSKMRDETSLIESPSEWKKYRSQTGLDWHQRKRSLSHHWFHCPPLIILYLKSRSFGKDCVKLNHATQKCTLRRYVAAILNARMVLWPALSHALCTSRLLQT